MFLTWYYYHNFSIIYNLLLLSHQNAKNQTFAFANYSKLNINSLVSPPTNSLTLHSSMTSKIFGLFNLLILPLRYLINLIIRILYSLLSLVFIYLIYKQENYISLFHYIYGFLCIHFANLIRNLYMELIRFVYVLYMFLTTL